MNEKIINKLLKEKAIDCGLCDQWKKEWEQDWDFEKLANQFYRGLDFYLKTRFIPTKFFKESFDIDFLRKNGILVDDKYSLLNPENAILIGNSNGTVRMNGFKATNVYVVDKSHLKIIAKNRSFVIVHALDRCVINASKNDLAHLVVIKHSPDVKVEGNAIVKEEYDYLK